MRSLKELKTLYAKGVNITQLLKEETAQSENTEEIVEIAYDLQAGSYVDWMADPCMRKIKDAVALAQSDIIAGLGTFESILEAGVGEGTTLSSILDKVGVGATCSAYGFDLSWSRIAVGRSWLEDNGFYDVELCTGNMFHMPYSDDSIDIVYTSHSIEPNGGKEKPLLEELYRVARKYLVLFEPCYSLAEPEGQERMVQLGYCRDLEVVADSLGYDVVSHERLSVIENPLNPTAVTVIRKGNTVGAPQSVLACPMCKTPLVEKGCVMFSPEGQVVYPIVAGIPCLRRKDAIMATKFEELVLDG